MGKDRVWQDDNPDLRYSSLAMTTGLYLVFSPPVFLLTSSSLLSLLIVIFRRERKYVWADSRGNVLYIGSNNKWWSNVCDKYTFEHSYDTQLHTFYCHLLFYLLFLSIAVSSARRTSRRNHFQAHSTARAKIMSAGLSKELREKHSVRAVPIRKDDEVKVVRGTYAGRDGKVIACYRKKYVIHVERITDTKINQQTYQVPIHPSNVEITKLHLDPDRKKLLARKAKKTSDKVRKPFYTMLDSLLWFWWYYYVCVQCLSIHSCVMFIEGWVLAGVTANIECDSVSQGNLKQGCPSCGYVSLNIVAGSLCNCFVYRAMTVLRKHMSHNYISLYFFLLRVNSPPLMSLRRLRPPSWIKCIKH